MFIQWYTLQVAEYGKVQLLRAAQHDRLASEMAEERDLKLLHLDATNFFHCKHDCGCHKML